MKSFQQHIESLQAPEGVIAHRHHLGQINDIIEKQERTIKRLVEKNDKMIKALAKIKIDLERALKDKSKLGDAVYSSINIARQLTPYTQDSGLSHSIDPPLEDNEKTL